MLRIYQLKQATVFADSDFVEIHDTSSLIFLAASSITLDGPGPASLDGLIWEWANLGAIFPSELLFWHVFL
jgi:hypothetical protein